MIIVFEGLDKMGKSTQARLMWDYLNEKGRKVKYFRQPDNSGDDFKKDLRRMISDPSRRLCPMAEWGLHLASHAQQWHSSILPAIDSGFDIILDRCWLSALVYQGYGKGVNYETIIRAENEACKKTKFDKVFIFYSALKNPLGREFDKTSMEVQLKTDEDFRRRVSYGYFKIAQERGYILIDSEGWRSRQEDLHKFIRGLCKND